MRQPQPRTPRWAIAVAGAILVAGIVVAAVVYLADDDGSSGAVARAQPAHRAARQPEESLPPQPETQTRVLPQAERRKRHVSGSGFLGGGAEASFATLAAELPAQVGLAVAPLGGGTPRVFGELQSGHAWSSIKVPILATVMREQGESLDAEEEGWAAGALTASDNEAAAALFGRLEDADGGLSGASQAVEETLRLAGDHSTRVATAPPPPGAVSTYGQTEWSLSASVRFYGSLAGGCLLGPSGAAYVEGLMEGVIPEQRWGLGEAGFPSGWSVGMKGGWGPEADAGGAYLVRQSGFVRDGERGIAVAMMAMDESGSYSAGAADLTRVAQWLAGEIQGLPPASSGC